LPKRKRKRKRSSLVESNIYVLQHSVTPKWTNDVRAFKACYDYLYKFCNDTTANINIRRGRVKSFYQHFFQMLASMKLTPSRFGRMYQSIKLSPRWRKSDSPLFKRDSCICVQGSTDCCCIFAAPLGMISRSVKPVFGKASANVTPLCLSQNA